MTYQHDPLQRADSIRLLLLSPREVYNLSCTLVEVRKSKRPPFEALSYSWGNATATESILVLDPSVSALSLSWEDTLKSSATMKISVTLSKALEALRLPGTFRYLWVDAICIDQANVEEKSEQVALMGDVYREAEAVIVWLGPQDDWVRHQTGLHARRRTFGNIKDLLRHMREEISDVLEREKFDHKSLSELFAPIERTHLFGTSWLVQNRFVTLDG